VASKDKTGTEDFEARADAVENLSADSHNSTYERVPGEEGDGHIVLQRLGTPS
jgi:hypothetical protein